MQAALLQENPLDHKRALAATTVTNQMIEDALSTFEGSMWGDEHARMEDALVKVMAPIREILSEAVTP